ncbi:MAG: hypothetical protein IJU37_08970 [Desulfovibrio sp.]|nr:hypothetical protein [Desulfovibrio sp.]
MFSSTTSASVPSLHILVFCLACFLPVTALAMSEKEADDILQDTFTIVGYVGMSGENEYHDKPLNVIRAALFGAFDAKVTYDIEQDSRKDAGKPPLTTPLLSVAGQQVSSEDVLVRDDAPSVFKGLPERYNVFVSRKAVELAALRYTGHSVTRHAAPAPSDLLGAVRLTEQGYFATIDGLGDLPLEAKLEHITPQGQGYVLTGKVIPVMEDNEETKEHFSLELWPGDASGTWKRNYQVK